LSDKPPLDIGELARSGHRSIRSLYKQNMALKNSSDTSSATEKKPMNKSLGAARAAKQDEFYTQYVDIQREVEAYLEFDPDTFRDKVVYCNCDDPFESNFFKYFAANFNKLGLKKLISTSYDGSPIAGQRTLFPEYDEGNGQRQKPKALAVIIDQVKDENGDGAVDITDVELFLKRNKAARIALKGSADYPGGDFRSPECVDFLKQADIVVTNPPFSLFREYVAQLVEHGKKFLIIGSQNAVTYKEIFPLVKENILWMGVTIHSGDREFRVPDHYPLKAAGCRIDENGMKYIRVKGVRWFTNLEHGRRHEKLPLMTLADNLKFSKHKEIRGKAAYDRYDNYDAIEVPYTDAIPSDYDGAMGVPITFLDKYNPEQFEILGITDRDNNSGIKTKVYTEADAPNFGDLNRRGVIRDGNILKSTYARLFIRHRHPAKGTK
jgi:hypothetical protein